MGPWSKAFLKRHFSTSDQGASRMGSQPKKAPHVSLTKSCVRALRGRKTKSIAKDPTAIKQRYSSNGRCICAKHRAQKAPPCHHRVPFPLILQLCSDLAEMSTEQKRFMFHHMYKAARTDETQHATKSGRSRTRWCIGEHKLCFRNFCYMLSCSTGTVTSAAPWRQGRAHASQ